MMTCSRCGGEMRSKRVDNRRLMFCLECPNVEDYPEDKRDYYIKINGVMVKCPN